MRSLPLERNQSQNAIAGGDRGGLFLEKATWQFARVHLLWFRYNRGAPSHPNTRARRVSRLTAPVELASDVSWIVGRMTGRSPNVDFGLPRVSGRRCPRLGKYPRQDIHGQIVTSIKIYSTGFGVVLRRVHPIDSRSVLIAGPPKFHINLRNREAAEENNADNLPRSSGQIP